VRANRIRHRANFKPIDQKWSGGLAGYAERFRRTVLQRHRAKHSIATPEDETEDFFFALAFGLHSCPRLNDETRCLEPFQ
jgi:hypothetical protein